LGGVHLDREGLSEDDVGVAVRQAGVMREPAKQLVARPERVFEAPVRTGAITSSPP